MSAQDEPPMRLRWARMRFSIISHLLASPPAPGELAARIEELAGKTWRHPTKDSPIRLSPKTIERMYYAARAVNDPVGVLARRVPKHAGARTRASRRRCPQRLRASTATTLGGPGSSTTTTSSRSRRPTQR